MQRPHRWTPGRWARARASVRWSRAAAVVTAVVVAHAVALASTVTAASPVTPSPATPSPTTPSPRQAAADVLIGAGDIAECSGIEDSATAALVAATAGTVFTLGDNVYPNASAADFAACYQPTWGAFRDRTRPVVGNHEYGSPGAAPYFAYFGAAAGVAGQGWYSYDVGTDWHVVVLNSNCAYVGGCGTQSPQVQWLRADLDATTRACTVAMWHHPRFVSTHPGKDPSLGAFWRVLYEDGAELVLNGHEHVYERFAAQDPAGDADPARGIRQFVVGTGGAELRTITKVATNSQARSATSYGVLKLSLRRGGYDWSFLPTPSSTYTDSGTGSCSGSLSPVATPGIEDQTCLGRAATMVGTDAKLVGTPGDDVIVSGRSRRVRAGAGNDLVCVTSSRGVRVSAQGGADVVRGGRGRDRLTGGGGTDSLQGRGGDDALSGGGSKDHLAGGPGRDTASGGGGRDRCLAERRRACER